MSVPSVIARAIELHRAGDLQQAQHLYQSVLETQPHHADALHLLGMLRHATGDSAHAERLIRSAILLQPNQPVYHSNLGVVLASAGKIEQAIQAYRRACELDPQSSPALNNLGVALHAAGQLDEAIDCFKKAVILQPDYFDARQNFLRLLHLDRDPAAANHAVGDLLHDAGKSADAILFYRDSLVVNAESAATWNNLGNAVLATGQSDQAFECYEKAVKLEPDFSQACNNLANLLVESGRLAEAIAAYGHAIKLTPNSPDLLSNFGNALREAGERQSAMDCYRRALAIDPDHLKTYNNLGNAFCEVGDWQQAVDSYQRAIAIDPNFSEAINNLGTALEEVGDRDHAMQCYLKARDLTPDSVSPPWNISLLQLLRGDYENGWLGYEHRWRQKKQCRSFRNFHQPLLSLRMNLTGKVILLHAEQGFGDAIQFCRYAPLVADLGGQVNLECPQPLIRLFQSLRGITHIIARGDPLPEFDVQCPLMSLPTVFGVTLEKMVASEPYLRASPTNLVHWQQRFASEPRAFRVGLVWAGSETHQKDLHRSLNLSAFEPLSGNRNIRFLQPASR